MTGFLPIQQHFLPIHFGNDSNLLNYESYKDFKEEFSVVSDHQSGRFNSKKFTAKLKKSWLKKISKGKNPSLVVDDDEAAYLDRETFADIDDDEGNEVYVSRGRIIDNDFSGDNLSDEDETVVVDHEERDERCLHQIGQDLSTGNATLKDVQEILASSQISALNFTHEKKLTLILRNGTIIHVMIKNIFSHEYIYIINQLFSFDEHVTSVAYGDRYVLFLLPDNRLIVARKYILSADQDEDLKNSENEEDSDDETQIQRGVDISTYKDFLPSMSLKKSDKHVVLKDSSDLCMIWWPNTRDEIFPWTPNPEQRANILIYSLEDHNEPILEYFIKTESNLLEARFVNGKKIVNEALTLESNSNPVTGQITVTETIYELIEGGGTKIKFETIIPLQSTITCYAHSCTDEKLAIGCFDSTLIFHTKRGKITHTSKCVFNPTAMSWHPDSHLLIVIGDQGQFQILDIALQPMLLHSNNNGTTSMTQELVPSISTETLTWVPSSSSSKDSVLLMKFRSGELNFLRIPIGQLKLINLINFYLTDSHIVEAIHVLRNVQWNSEDCLYGIYSIYGELIMKDYSEEVELQIDDLLDIYFNPTIEPDLRVHKKHARAVYTLAARFFSWLVRASKFERALQVAVSLKHNGLLRHLRSTAIALGLDALADEADASMSCHSSEESGSEDESSETESSTGESRDSEDSSSSYSRSEGTGSNSSESESGSTEYTDNSTTTTSSPGEGRGTSDTRVAHSSSQMSQRQHHSTYLQVQSSHRNSQNPNNYNNDNESNYSTCSNSSQDSKIMVVNLGSV